MQFDLHPHRGHDRERVPFLLDLQSDRAGALRTTLVCPVVPLDDLPTGDPRLVTVQVSGASYVAVVPELFAVDRAGLARPVANLSEQRYRFAAALDLLLTTL